MLSFTTRHFEKPLIPSSTQLTRKPPKAALKSLGRPSFPGYGYELVRRLHHRLPYMEDRRATGKKSQFKLGSLGGQENAFCFYH